MIRFLARLQPSAILVLRLTLGVTLIYHSWSKVYPPGGFHHGHYLAAVEKFNDLVVRLGMPRFLGYISTLTEFAGGLFLILGLLTRFWSFLVLINMLVALVTVNLHRGYSGSEYTLALIAIAFLLLTTGSGAFSLDRRISLL